MNHATNKPGSKIDLPQKLRENFEALEKRLWRFDTLLLAGRSASAVAASYAGLWLSDRLGDTPTWIRTSWTLAGVVGVATAVWVWRRRWGGKGMDLERLSVKVQSKYRGLGDTLLGIVELSDESKRPAGYSSELYAAAIEQVAERASKFDFSLAVDPRPARQQLWLAGGLSAVAAATAMISPAVAGNAAGRWIRPWAQIERLTLVGWTEASSTRIVPHGEGFQIQGTPVYRSFWKPRDGWVRIDGGSKRPFQLTDGKMQAEMPGLANEALLEVRLGDAVRKVTAKPVHRPSLRSIAAEVSYPEYLQYGTTNLAIQGGVLSVVQGSSVQLEGEASRALVEVRGGLSGGAALGWTVSSARFESSTFKPASTETLALSWTDTLGLSNSPLWQIAVHSEKDGAPSVEMSELAREVAILESEVMDVKVAARDDFGVKDVGLRWEDVSAAGSETGPTNRTALPAGYRQRARSPKETRLQETFSFSPSLHGFKADTSLDLLAYAHDFLPGRDPSVSTRYRVHVLGAERHAEMVRQRLEALLSRLEEVTRAEERVSEGTKSLQESIEKLSQEAAAAKASELAEEQKLAADLLDQIAQEGLRTLREATRNPALDNQTLRQWANHLQSMKEVSAKSMSKAAKSLQAARQNPKERSQKLSEAKDQEEEAIESLEQLQKDVNAGLDDLQALTLAQRLRKLGEGEQSIQSRMNKAIGDTIGLLPSELTDSHRRLHTALSKEQLSYEEESKKVEGEISRFFERTRRPEYGQVTEAMKGAKPAEELEKVRGLINENIGMEAMQRLALWSSRFEEWAKTLEPKSKPSSGNSQGQQFQGEEAEKLMEMLLGLLRSRESQGGIRERTRMLDHQGKKSEEYEDSSRMLASEQQKLILQMHALRELNPSKGLDPILAEAFNTMRRAEGLLNKPQTDQVTMGTHAKSMELLTDAINLINEQTERGRPQPGEQQQAPSSEEMAFLMQMMQQQGQGMSPMSGEGGNPGQGGTGSGAAQPGGGAEGRGSAGRAVSKGSGQGGTLPAEFREALEGFFQGIEDSER